MQRKLQISTEDLNSLKKRKKDEQNAKIFKRLMAVEMRAYGGKCKDIAALLGVCIDTIADWTNLFLEGGIEVLCSLQYEGRRPSKLKSYTEEIRKKAKEDSLLALKQLRDWLQEKHALSVEESWLFRFCKKNSIFPIKKPD